MSNDAVMVDTITGSEVAPTWAIWVSGKPNPSKNHGGLQNLLRCKCGSRRREACLSRIHADNASGEEMANTAPPTMGTAVPKTSRQWRSAALVAIPGARVRIVTHGVLSRLGRTAKFSRDGGLIRRFAFARRAGRFLRMRMSRSACLLHVLGKSCAVFADSGRFRCQCGPLSGS